MKNVGNSSRGRSQGVPKFFRAPMYRAHCAVIFAIAHIAFLSVIMSTRYIPVGHNTVKQATSIIHLLSRSERILIGLLLDQNDRFDRLCKYYYCTIIGKLDARQRQAFTDPSH